MMKKVILFFGLVSGTGFVTAQHNLQYISSTTGAAAYVVEEYDGYLYTGAGNTLLVYDLSTSVPYVKTFEHRFVSNIDDIKIYDNRLYVCANHDGLSVWSLSSPSQPFFLDQVIPDSLGQAAYSMAFYGDTIFVSYKTRVAVFYFNTSAGLLSLQNTFANQSGESLVRGIAVKNNLLAFTTAYGTNSQTGIHIWDIPTLIELSFYQQDFADPENVLFSVNAPLLNVLGGTESWQTGNPKGIFYSLNISNPQVPFVAHSDTLNGLFFFYIAIPLKGQIVNDTLYFATNGAPDSLSAAGDTAGYVYVYDVSDAGNVHFITNINAGLWHFDVAVASQKMYVASEWYGVKTVDIFNLQSPVDLGLTLTGGWNTAADKFGSRMVLAQEGYGFKQYDITDIHNPQLLNVKVEVGFCFGIHYDKTGNYIFSFNYTGDDFRVYRSSDLVMVSSVNSNGGITVTDFFKERVWNDKALAIAQPITFGIGTKKIIVFDVSDIMNPFVDTTLSPAGILQDMEVDVNGKLFVSTTSYLYVYDLSNNFQQLVSVPVTFLQQFSGIALYEDTLYTYVSGLNPGIEKYVYDGGIQLLQVGGIFPLSVEQPEYLAADEFGLYLSYQEHGLYAFDKTTVSQSGYYKHGLEFYRPSQWGQRGLFCEDDLVFLVEYFGQTTILSNDDSLHSSIDDVPRIINSLSVFPVPANDLLWVNLAEKNTSSSFEIYNSKGNKLLECHRLKMDIGSGFTIDISDLPPGIYFIRDIVTGLSKRFIKI